MFLKKNKKLSVLVIGALLASSSFWVAGCGSNQQAAQKQGQQVKVMQVIQQDTPLSSEYAGQIAGVEEVKVQSKVSGNVVEKYVQGGQYVEAGQPLYKIDSRQYESAVLAAQANLAQSQATLANAQTDLYRYESLLAGNAISEQTVTTQQANVNAYSAAADANAAQLQRAQEDLADTTIYAPISGQLSVDDVAVGTFAAAGNTTLVTMGAVNPVYAQFAVSETEYLKLMNEVKQQDVNGQTGGPVVTLTLADGSVYPQQGRIVSSDRALGNNTGTLTVKAVFDNPDGLLLPGMFARVKLTGETIPNAILVPQRAVQQLLDKTFVMVVGDDGKSEARSIELGQQVGSYYVVKSGLSASDTVVVEGLSSLTEGKDLAVTMVTPEDMGFSFEEDTTPYDTMTNSDSNS